jgi:2-polyprenyl-3-methyl-5-hydroxy-6-metoxy-1,4-benzoquinol methylase
VRRFADVRGKRYFDCPECRLVHLSPDHRLDAASERAHYAQHENSPSSAGYRAFLERAAGPLMRRLSPGASGLDYGAGPGPTLSVMLEERGMQMCIYDPHFAPDPAPLARTFDFITCTETAEHFFRPGEEFARLDALLRPGGSLAVMTQLLRDDSAFEAWSYVRDPTHVSFYRTQTMAWIAERHGWRLAIFPGNVVLFDKAA